jgi:HK97 gp10 family phage protein
MANLVECEVKGLEEIQHALESVPRAIARGLLRKAMARAANIWREEMARMAPRLVTVKLARNPKQVRLPGDLARHIGIKVLVNSDLEGSVQVGPSKRVFWSKFLEFGTYKMSAHPFIRPAFESMKSKVLDKFVEEGKAIISSLRLQQVSDNPNTAGSSSLAGDADAALAEAEAAYSQASAEIAQANAKVEAAEATIKKSSGFDINRVLDETANDVIKGIENVWNAIFPF